MSNKIKFFALGGLDENGKDMYCFDINNEIYLVEAGLKYPENQNLGIDIEIPSFDYLVKNKDRVKAIFITHAHPDTMGSITYLIKELNIPIYATQLTSWLIEDQLKAAKIKDYKINRLKNNSIIKLNDQLKVHSFKTTHSITQSIGLAFETEQGFMVFTSDFLIDSGASDEYQTDIHKIVDISKKGVLALLAESVSAQKVGHTSPNHKIQDKIEPIISKAKSRIIVSVYTNSVYNIKEIIQTGVDANYRIIILNDDLKDLVHKHEKLGIPIVDQKDLADISEINNGNVLVIISGNGADLYKQLSMIANDGHDDLKPTTEDTFIIASPAIPGIEDLAIKVIDDIYRLDSEVYTFSSKQVASMHAAQEDLKLMIGLLQPKYYIPIKGDYTQMIANAKIGMEMGMDSDDIIVLENGEVVTFEKGQLQKSRSHIKINSVLIDGNTVNDSQGVVLNDRLSLSQDGTVIIGVGLDRKSKEIVTSIDVQTRGFIYIKDSEYIIDEIKNITQKIVESFDFKKDNDFSEAKNKIRDKVSRYIYKETAKKPIVLSMIITV